jgi:putative lipoic acid-binding regulatory protein
MLPDRISRLLTACIDGELDTHQRKAVLRLLRQSSEARQLLHDLKNDAKRLRGLPCQTLGQDFSEQLLQIINSRTAPTTQRSTLMVRSSIPAWLGLATAAAVLLIAGLGSAVYLATVERSRKAELLAWNRPESTQPSTPEGMAESDAPPEPSPEINRREPLSFPAPEQEMKVASTSGAPSPDDGKLQADPKPTALGSPLRDDAIHFKDLEAPIPPVFNLRDLDPKKRQLLLQEMQKEAVHRIDLRCTDTLAGMQRLQTAFESQGIQLVIDQDAQAVLKLGMGKNAPFALYSDEVTAEEIVAILQQFSSEDRKMESKRAGKGRFETLMVNTLARQEEQKLFRSLGIDPAQFHAPVPKGKAAVDIRKPLSADTQEHVIRSLNGNGTPPTESGERARKTLDRQALVVMVTPGRPRPMSAELKRFLDNRKERRAGSVEIVLVLAPTKG